MKKHLTLIFFSILLSLTGNAQKATTIVGKLESGMPILTVDKATILKTYNAKLLKYSGIDDQFSNIQLMAVNENDFSLVFSGPVYKSVFYVQTRGADLYALAGTSCTTSDCPSEPKGCTVKYDGRDLGFCSPCSLGGKCTKNELF